MVNIYLHGMLGRKFGKHWTLEVSSVAEAIHAIDINLGGKLRSYWSQNPRKEYRVKIGDGFVMESIEIQGPCGKGDIHIMPVLKGRKSGIGKILMAVALVALIIVNPANMFWAKGALTAWGVAAATAATSLALGGVSQLLAPKVGFNNTTDSSNPNSFTFGGTTDTIRQGLPVPVAYGRVLINPLPVSISLFHEDHTAGGTTPPPTVDVDTNTNFQPEAGSPPPSSPVGQNVTVTTSANLYLGTFATTATNNRLGPSVIPSQSSPYQQKSN
jgi:predicted phage tail protein